MSRITQRLKRDRITLAPERERRLDAHLLSGGSGAVQHFGCGDEIARTSVRQLVPHFGLGEQRIDRDQRAARPPYGMRHKRIRRGVEGTDSDMIFWPQPTRDEPTRARIDHLRKLAVGHARPALELDERDFVRYFACTPQRK